MELITKALHSAETGETVVLDDAPTRLSARPLPMWMPHGTDALEIAMDASSEDR